MARLYKSDINELTRHSNAQALGDLHDEISTYHEAKSRMSQPGGRQHEFHTSAYISHNNLSFEASRVYSGRVVSRAEKTPVTYRQQKYRKNLS